MEQKHLKKISRTSQYSYDREPFLRLDANERVIPFKGKIVSDLKKIITNNVLQSYPTSSENLIKLISKKERLNRKFITLVPGSDSAIKYIFEIFNNGKKKVISISPTYGMLEVYSKIYKFKLKKILESKFKKNFLKKNIFSNISFIYIANPNQPSGNLINYKLLVEIIKESKMRKKYIIVDEAYIDFASQKSCSSLVKKYNNLIILKTFSKSLGLAGLRIGYVICNPSLAKTISAVRPIFDISHFSMKAAEYFIKNKSILNQHIKDINQSRKVVKKECLKRKLNYLDTHANFFHIFLQKREIKKVSKFLKNKKILIKSKFSKGFGVLENSIRVTYGSKRQMLSFFRAFDKIYYRT